MPIHTFFTNKMKKLWDDSTQENKYVVHSADGLVALGFGVAGAVLALAIAGSVLGIPLSLLTIGAVAAVGAVAGIAVIGPALAGWVLGTCAQSAEEGAVSALALSRSTCNAAFGKPYRALCSAFNNPSDPATPAKPVTKPAPPTMG